MTFSNQQLHLRIYRGLNPFYIMETILIDGSFDDPYADMFIGLNPFYIMETILIVTKRFYFIPYVNMHSLNPFYIMETILMETLRHSEPEQVRQCLNPFYIMETILINHPAHRLFVSLSILS